MPFPSQEQHKVITHRGTPLVVIAGPGTGKTRTLVARMIALLEEDQTREVTFITFTRTSRRDTQRKLTKALEDRPDDRPQLMFPRTGTLHTYAKRLVHRFSRVIQRAPTFSVLIDERGETALLVEEVASDMGIAANIGELARAIAEARATLVWPDDCVIPAELRPAVLDRFEELLVVYDTYDMQGLVLAASRILQSDEAALPSVFLQVDEYQDLNPSDQRFLSLLASRPASQIVVVGDDAQSIYRFRFANYLGIRELWEGDGWEKVRFSDAHRLPPHILNAAILFMAGRGYLGAEINPKPPSDRTITVLQCTQWQLQTEAIARDIEARYADIVATGGREPHLKDFLVLCPTSDQVQRIAADLQERFGVPTHTPSRSTVPEAYWNVILLLRIAATDDPLALRQWLPVLGVPPELIRNLRHQALAGHTSFADLVYATAHPAVTPFHAAILHTREQATFPAPLCDALSRVQGAEIPAGLQTELQALTLQNGQLPRLPQLIQRLYERFGVLDREESVADQDKVLIATMHGAKGLEADYVYCPWLNSTFMPVAGHDEEEERRVLYVALTRAKRDVILLFPETFDAARRRRLGREVMSPFLAEIATSLGIQRATVTEVRASPPAWFRPEANAA